MAQRLMCRFNYFQTSCNKAVVKQKLMYLSDYLKVTKVPVILDDCTVTMLLWILLLDMVQVS